MNAEVAAVLRRMVEAIEALGQKIDQQGDMLARTVDSVKKKEPAARTKRKAGR